MDNERGLCLTHLLPLSPCSSPSPLPCFPPPSSSSLPLYSPSPRDTLFCPCSSVRVPKSLLAPSFVTITARIIVPLPPQRVAITSYARTEMRVDSMAPFKSCVADGTLVWFEYSLCFSFDARSRLDRNRPCCWDDGAVVLGLMLLLAPFLHGCRGNVARRCPGLWWWYRPPSSSSSGFLDASSQPRCSLGL